MAQVSLGEVLSSPDARAYSAINSKRVDLLIVSRSGDPIAAIEYQGHGHYQGTAAARDAVKKEALRKAGVRYIEVTPESGTEEMVREISRIAQVERLKPNTSFSDGDEGVPNKECGALRRTLGVILLLCPSYPPFRRSGKGASVLLPALFARCRDR